MTITFTGRKLVHRGARNLLLAHEDHPGGYGATLSVASATSGLSAFFVNDTEKTAAPSVHFWSPSDAFTSIQVAADAPLGPGSVTFRLTPDAMPGLPALPAEEVALNVTVSECPFAEAPPPLPGLPVVLPTAADPWGTWLAHLKGPIRQICEGPVDVSSEEGVWYYDGVDLAMKAAKLTGDASWVPLAAKIADAYLGDDSTKQGNRPGYEVFGRGLCNLYLATGDMKYLRGAISLAEHAAFMRANSEIYDATPAQMRPTAYALELELALGEAGAGTMLGRVADLADLLLLQLDALFLSVTWATCVPYQVGLAARALIHYLEEAPFKDARVLPYLQAAADGLWRDAWLPGARPYFRYTYLVPGATQGVLPIQDADATDLNLLLAPLYAWVYSRTKDTSYRDKADDIFAAGVKGAYFDGSHGKQASQQVYFADRFQEWRNA
jgi:hypothetical protein